MRAIDRWAIDKRGVPSLDLMERAGAGVARAVERLVPDGPAVVVCGTGNNGGDGLVVARLLRDAGRKVTVVCAGSPAKLTGDALANLERLPGEAPLELGRCMDALAGASVVVDALLGTGFAGEPRGEVGEAIAAIEGCSAPVVSIDVPSGVDASTGVVAGAAVRTAKTVTFHAAKPGLWIHPGKAHAGEVEVLDIGIPRGGPDDADIGLIASAVLRLLPRRSAVSTKFSSGHVLVAGGSRGLTGAPRMAALGAMRAGAGYVTACVPASQQAIVASGGPPELMTRGLPDSDGSLTPAGIEVVLEAARRGGALALGPGLGRGDHAVAFARALARGAEVPLVLDADGLNAHAGNSAPMAPAISTISRRAARRRCSHRIRASWRGCSTPTPITSRANAWHTSVWPRREPVPWSCSRATIRSSPIPPDWSPSAPATVPRWLPPAAGTCSAALSRRCSPRAWSRSRRPRRVCCCTSGPAVWLRARRAPPRV